MYHGRRVVRFKASYRCFRACVKKFEEHFKNNKKSTAIVEYSASTNASATVKSEVTELAKTT